LDEARLLGVEQHLSVHASGLRDALLLAQALKVLPPEVVIFGVQPANLDWNSALSPEVEATLPGLIAAVLTQVGSSAERSIVRRPPRAEQGEDKHGKDLDD
jgi:hydrogenase maturation protease